MKKIFLSTIIALLVLSVVATAAFAAPQGAGKPCLVPGRGNIGAMNMLKDPTMWTVAMVHDAIQGFQGMYHATAESFCP